MEIRSTQKSNKVWLLIDFNTNYNLGKKKDLENLVTKICKPLYKNLRNQVTCSKIAAQTMGVETNQEKMTFIICAKS